MYTPNLNDPRIKARIKKALGFTCAVMRETPHEWSTRYIDKYFGVQSNDLSKWLRKQLLVVDSHRYNKDTAECKSYTINKTGVRYLRDILAGSTQAVSAWTSVDVERKKQSLRDLVENDYEDEIKTPLLYPSVLQVEVDEYALAVNWAKDEFKDELLTYNFIYEDKSNRLWHPLQNLRREYKKTVFTDAGFNYQYDIECCAPTLIHQYSQHLGMDLYLFALRKYINDRRAVRREIAQYTGVTEKQAKEIVNSLFAGSKIGVNKDFAIYKMLNGDAAKINKLKEMPYINELRSDIRICWDYIKPTMYRDTRTSKTGKEVLVPISARQKWNIYFDLERKVLRSVTEYLTETGNKHFTEHDGWTCVNEIDENALIEYVYRNVGYKIKLNVDRLSSPLLYPSVLQVEVQDEKAV